MIIIKRLALLGTVVVAVSACSKLPSRDANSSEQSAAPSTPAPAATRVRGEVQSVGPTSLALHTYDGKSVNVTLGNSTKFAWVVASNLASLKSGDFVGTATTGPDNALRAVELVIFPEAMRGSGEGHYAWDVPGAVAAAGKGSSGSSGMTNGTVQQQSGMTNGTVQMQNGMTNGIVTDGTGKSGETTLTIGYKGGTAKVLVPTGTPIVRFEPTTASVLSKGQKLFVVQAPGVPEAKFVAIGKDGLTPPM